MASTSIQDITSSCDSPPQWMYDVFLSFRGEDTRLKFTSHLYSNMVQRGIDVYMDDRELERGQTIEPALWKAIEESRFSVIIFSIDYASSPWCLDELVKIVQCMKEMGHTILPVFYDVDPSGVAKVADVAERKGKYWKAFVEHEKNFKEDKIRNWKDCVTTVANVSGWDVRNRSESESIKIIVDYIEDKLRFSLPKISKNLVGIDSRLKVLNGYIDEEANGVLFIGICGMGGIGKTTLARAVYERISWKFQGSCFLANVREDVEKQGPRLLQKRLLSEILMQRVEISDSLRGIDMIKRRLRRKKVLLILDDVDDNKQLEFLAAEHGWFGPGSRIIITTRNKDVLIRIDDTRIYEVEKLNDVDALMLFSRKAFKKDQPTEVFRELSKQVVGYADGLPLALEVVGSSLRNREISYWISAINRLKDIPNSNIIDVLRISFNGLDEIDKKIFLDIACFFKGFKKDRIKRMLESCGYHEDVGIQTLIEKSLINFSQDKVGMHDLLQIMGKQIVCCESREEPRRLGACNDVQYNDVRRALMDNKGKKKIETIFLDMPEMKEAEWNMKAFSEMSELRLLKINNVQFSKGPEHLSNELRFLEWHNYPSKSLPARFQLDKLVELHMTISGIQQLWDGIKSLRNLKIINLSNSPYLTRTPDFTEITNLESLILEGCTSLSEVHPSLGLHEKLQHLNLVRCTSIQNLPKKLRMKSLEVCTLSGCSKLENFPDIDGHMDCLKELRLDETSIAELSPSIYHLISLDLLSMNNCKHLESIPSSIVFLKSLKTLDLSGCSELKSIPSSIGCLKSLKTLDLSGCSELKNIPEDLGKVESLEELDVGGSSIRQPPASIFLLKKLKVLRFDGCNRIAANPADQVLPSLSGLSSLEDLDLRACNLSEGALPEDIGCLSSLRCLDLSRNNFVSLPKTINQLFQLEKLILEDCTMLESLPEVPSKVHTVNLNGCTRLKDIPDLINLSSSKRSEITCLNCWELKKYDGQDSTESSMLEKCLQGASNLRPGFAIVVPGNEIPGWFNHQSKGSSIRVQVPSWCTGYALCVAFSGCSEIASLSCHIKVNGREDYHSPMCIGCNSIQNWSDHVWLFCLSFDYLKEQQQEPFNNIELSFHFDEKGVKVKNCGVCLLYTPTSQSSSAHFVLARKEAASSYRDSLASSASYHQWMHTVFGVINASNEFFHLNNPLALRRNIPDDRELANLIAIRSELSEAIKKSGLSVIVFARDCAYLAWSLDELVKIVGLVNEMKMKSAFPASYDGKQSNIDDQTESYTIVFAKDGEDFTKNEKVERWMVILTKVIVSTEIIEDRFGPTDGMLEQNSLERKIREESLEFDNISDIDIYLCDPDDLLQQGILDSGDWEWHFFYKKYPSDKKYPGGYWSKRATITGNNKFIICYSRKGTKEIEGLSLDMSQLQEQINLKSDAFARMDGLRFLNFYFGDSLVVNKDKVHLPPNGLEYLPSKLRYFLWDGFPSKSLAQNFRAQHLVELNLRKSKVEKLWTEVQNLENLTTIILDYSLHLTELPDLSKAKNLEVLSLEGCKSLIEISSSLQCLNKLKSINLQNCSNLCSLPRRFDSEFLELLALTGCSYITNCPEISGNMRRLELSATCIRELPQSISKLENLRNLDLSDCKQLSSLPTDLYRLRSLQRLDLRGCSKLGSFPEITEPMESLGNLDLSDCTQLSSLPTDLYRLKSLTELNLRGCSKLESFPEIMEPMESLVSLNLSDCTHLSSLPTDLYRLRSLERLYLRGCSKLESFPEIMEPMEYLVSLDLSDCTQLSSLPSIENLIALRDLVLDGAAIKKITKLPRSLQSLQANGCKSLKTLPGIDQMSDLWRELSFANCFKLNQRDLLAEFMQLKIQSGQFPKWQMQILLPGSEISKWWGDQGEGSTKVTRQALPSDRGRLIGIAFCVVFVPVRGFFAGFDWLVRSKGSVIHKGHICPVRINRISINEVDHVFFLYEPAPSEDHFSSCYGTEVTFQFSADVDRFSPNPVKRYAVRPIFSLERPTSSSDSEEDEKVENSQKDIPAAVFGGVAGKREEPEKDAEKDDAEDSGSRLGALERIKN